MSDKLKIHVIKEIDFDDFEEAIDDGRKYVKLKSRDEPYEVDGDTYERALVWIAEVNAKQEELKSCPFCGGEAHLYEDNSSELNETRYNVWHECEGFEGDRYGYGHSLHPWFETPWYLDKATAIAAWNRRAE